MNSIPLSPTPKCKCRNLTDSHPIAKRSPKIGPAIMSLLSRRTRNWRMPMSVLKRLNKITQKSCPTISANLLPKTYFYPYPENQRKKCLQRPSSQNKPNPRPQLPRRRQHLATHLFLPRQQPKNIRLPRRCSPHLHPQNTWTCNPLKPTNNIIRTTKKKIKMWATYTQYSIFRIKRWWNLSQMHRKEREEYQHFSSLDFLQRQPYFGEN